MSYDKCPCCEQDKRVRCPGCGQAVRTSQGVFVTHDHGTCTGSHMEYKTCKNSGKKA